MNILFVIGQGDKTGSPSVKRIKFLAKGLSILGFETYILFISPTPRGNLLSNDWIADESGVYSKTIYCSSRLFGPLKLFLRKIDSGKILEKELNESIRDIQWNCIFLYGQSRLFFNAAISFCKMNKILVLADLTEWYPLGFKRVFSPNYWDHVLFRSITIRRCSGVVAISRAWEHYAQMKNVDVITIPSMSELQEFNAKASLPKKLTEKDKPFVLTYVGPMSPRDLPFALLEAIRELVNSNIDVSLYIVGKVDSQQSGRKAKEIVAKDKLLRNNVTFTNWVTNSKLRELMQNSDAFCTIA